MKTLPLFALFLVASACTEQIPKEVPKPLPEKPAPKVIRVVETRNPFGDTAVVENLVVDGDFEFTGRSQQMPWLAFGRSGQQTLNYSTGGACLSGIRCAALKKGDEIFGWVGSPKRGTVSISVWVKPESGACADAKITYLDLENGSRAHELPTPEVVDERGWCHFESQSASLPGGQTGLYIQSVNGPVLVDHAVAQAGPASAQGRALTSLSTATQARIKMMREWIRSHRDDPNPVEKVPTKPNY